MVSTLFAKISDQICVKTRGNFSISICFSLALFGNRQFLAPRLNRLRSSAALLLNSAGKDENFGKKRNSSLKKSSTLESLCWGGFTTSFQFFSILSLICFFSFSSLWSSLSKSRPTWSSVFTSYFSFCLRQCSKATLKRCWLVAWGRPNSSHF